MIKYPRGAVYQLSKKLIGVYMIYDCDGVVCYVGMSTNLQHRIYQHFIGADKKLFKYDRFFDSYSYIECSNRIEALSIESDLIVEYAPYFNQAKKLENIYQGKYPTLYDYLNDHEKTVIDHLTNGKIIETLSEMVVTLTMMYQQNLNNTLTFEEYKKPKINPELLEEKTESNEPEFSYSYITQSTMWRVEKDVTGLITVYNKNDRPLYVTKTFDARKTLMNLKLGKIVEDLKHKDFFHHATLELVETEDLENRLIEIIRKEKPFHNLSRKERACNFKVNTWWENKYQAHETLYWRFNLDEKTIEKIERFEKFEQPIKTYEQYLMVKDSINEVYLPSAVYEEKINYLRHLLYYCAETREQKIKLGLRIIEYRKLAQRNHRVLSYTG